MINTQTFYAHFHGHPLDDLAELHDAARASGSACMFLASDSTMDTKHWLYAGDKYDPRALYDRDNTAMAPQQYVALMTPPRALKDVAFWVNRMAADEGQRLTALNLAVEESTLAEKRFGLNAHDCFIRDNLRPDDILVVSIGGNDIVLRPTWKTIVAAGALLVSPTTLIEAEWAPGLGHFRAMFKGDVEEYLKKLTSKTVPSTILVCMTYFPDENGGDRGWASKALGAMGYNIFPGKLQLLIRKVYEISTMEVEVPGARVIPVPLFEALDGKNTDMYVERVEPSAQGGRAIARLLLEKMRM